MKRILLFCILIITLLPALLVSGSDALPPESGNLPPEVYQEVSLVLDGVSLRLWTPFLPEQTFLQPDPDDPVQVASLVQKAPRFQALTLTAIPYGSRSNAEIFPTIEAGKVDAYREDLRAFRQKQGGKPQDGPVAILLGQQVTGLRSTVPLYIDVFQPKPVQIVEWLFEAGQRFWILRISQEVPSTEGDSSDMPSAAPPVDLLSDIHLTAADLAVPSTSLEAIETPAMAAPQVIPSADSDLPFPHWWNGDCDMYTYYAQASMYSYPLGAEYRGVKACGPRPFFDEAPDVLVRIYPDWHGMLEWECVELSMRFLFLAYGVPTYPANGNQVVTNYSGDTLIKINDGTPGIAPQPNDVLSLGPETTWGHTSVIIASDVDENGNGSIAVLEQNANPTGTRTYTVSDWRIQSSYIVIGWLHDPGGNDHTPPSGDLLEPLPDQVIPSPSIHLEGWAIDDDSGLSSAQFIADYDGTWREVGPIFSDVLFAYDWDWCAAGVPDGPISLALRLVDQAGNQNPGLPGLRGVVKDYPCAPTPACTPSADQVALFSEINYGGGCQLLGVGSYASGTAFGPAGDNNTASLLVGANVMATLYTAESFQGRRETLAGNDANLADNLIGTNSLSSMVVANRTTPPAVPSHLWPGNMATLPDSQSITLLWQNQGGATQMRAIIDEASLSEISPWGTATSWSLGTLSPGIYSWRLQARNPAGESAWSDWHFFIIDDDGAPPLDSVSSPWLDSLEGSTSGWQASGLWHLVTSDSHSSSHSWWYGQDTTGNYNTTGSNAGSLTTPPIILPVQADPYFLTFWSKYQTESAYPHWDQRRVQISLDGSRFFDIYQFKDDPMDTWLSASLDLSPYYSPDTSHTLQVRFNFDTLDDDNNLLTGWLLDDIQVKAQDAEACSDPNEPNDRVSQATTVAYGETRTAAICPGGDYDLYTFSGAAGDRIVVDVDATSIGSLLDAMVTLLDSDGSSVLALHDDEVSGVRKDPHLGYQLPRDGTYFLMIQAWDHPMGAGAYRFKLFTDPTPPVILSTLPASGGFLPSGDIPLTVNASDVGSGVSHVQLLGFSDHWFEIGQDWDGSNGWEVPFNTSTLAEGDILSFYYQVYDWANNITGAPAWEVTLDFTYPHTSAPALVNPNPTTAIPLNWSSTDNISGIRNHHVRSQKNSEDWITVTFDAGTQSWWFVGAADNTYNFRIRATDNAGNIEPYLEGAQVSTSIPAIATVCASFDDWDGSATVNDNSPGNAPLLSTSLQTHNFCNPAASDRLNDVDWIHLPVSEGHLYTVSALPQNPGAAVVIGRYAEDGSTLLQQVVPTGFGTPTIMVWEAAQDGDVYLKLRHLDGAVAGSAVTYQVSYQVDTGSILYLPIINK